ncbi:hypothetical protein [uncultured Microscilla sp.]|uniref:hypothetical protein n=1 Tax=uncultured Microscilla sp. TaxID=432653 RepID=UPI0026254EFA|nr:hypothetical protein [uncultured Microscilla sp.]
MKKQIQYLIIVVCLVGLGSCQKSEEKQTSPTVNQETTQQEAKKPQKEVKKKTTIRYQIQVDKAQIDKAGQKAEVKFNISPKTPVKVAVTDVGGHIIRGDSVAASASAHSLDLKGLRNGIYLVSVIAPGGQSASTELFWRGGKP